MKKSFCVSISSRFPVRPMQRQAQFQLSAPLGDRAQKHTASAAILRYSDEMRDLNGCSCSCPTTAKTRC